MDRNEENVDENSFINIELHHNQPLSVDSLRRFKMPRCSRAGCGAEYTEDSMDKCIHHPGAPVSRSLHSYLGSVSKLTARTLGIPRGFEVVVLLFNYQQTSTQLR